MRLANITIDCQEPSKLVGFWADLLGWRAVPEDDLIEPKPGWSWLPTIWFQQVPEPKQVKNRLHLDINVDDMDAAVEAAVAGGATDRGRRSERFGPFEGTHTILQDPEGNEFCLQPNPVKEIPGPYLCNLTFDCAHPFSMARFWAQAVGYPWAEPTEEFLSSLRDNGVDEAELDSRAGIDRPDTRVPRLWFQRVPEPKDGKNRMHVDLSSSTRAADVEALVAAGATILGEHGDWTVLADPEGNEFCVTERGA